MTDKIFAAYDFNSDIAANRPATPVTGGGRLYVFLATDTHAVSIWDGAQWVSFSNAADCCFAFLNTDQVVTNGVFTIVKMDTVSIDTQSAYNVSTGKYTPTRAGKYRVFFNTRAYVTTAMSDVIGRILKNGVNVAQFTMEAASAGTAYSDTNSGECIVQMNGTTDFVETWVRVTGSGGGDNVYGGANTYLVVQYLGT